MPVLINNEATEKELIPGIKAKMVVTKELMTLISEITFGIQEEPLPMHSHPAEQTTYILEGELIVFIEGEEPQKIGKGDMYYVEANIPHTVQCLTEVVRVVESFSPLRPEFL
ncbi:MAG: cupin domain-containing protein [Flavobacteriaceae bacterium]|nr:cupin domain-containing protein [Flavobacteriaceae bacterium]